ncbi:hypothetical protein AVEN_26269-1 [Araneus ventricosus]|uniref:Uncharacterized protein n=1 Tax=Araneus ventricosus TaxID=182803 RepID=A0A4Y2ANN5_ARAVE|nr:hypothetical protein AVEN_26269-1 [Araneus ventricosus]
MEILENTISLESVVSETWLVLVSVHRRGGFLLLAKYALLHRAPISKYTPLCKGKNRSWGESNNFLLIWGPTTKNLVNFTQSAYDHTRGGTWTLVAIQVKEKFREE